MLIALFALIISNSVFAQEVVLTAPVDSPVVVTRKGREVKTEANQPLKVVLVEQDTIRVTGTAVALISWPGSTLKLAPSTHVVLEKSPNEGKPAVFSLIYGHAAVAVNRAGAKTQDAVRIRVPVAMIGVKGFIGKGAVALLHVNRSEQEYYSQIAESSDKAIPSPSPVTDVLPKVTAIGEMKVFSELHTRIDVLMGAFVFRENESQESTTVSQGSSLILALHKPHPDDESRPKPAVTKLLAGEAEKIRKALGI